MSTSIFTLRWHIRDLTSFGRVFGLSGLDSVGSANLEANIVSTLQAGCFAGALAASWFADKFGRRVTLFGCAMIAIIGTIMQAASSGELAAMYCGRSVSFTTNLAILVVTNNQLGSSLVSVLVLLQWSILFIPLRTLQGLFVGL